MLNTSITWVSLLLATQPENIWVWKPYKKATRTCLQLAAYVNRLWQCMSSSAVKFQLALSKKISHSYCCHPVGIFKFFRFSSFWFSRYWNGNEVHSKLFFDILSLLDHLAINSKLIRKKIMLYSLFIFTLDRFSNKF